MFKTLGLKKYYIMKIFSRLLFIAVFISSGIYVTQAQAYKDYPFYSKADKFEVLTENFKDNSNGWVQDNNWLKGSIDNNSYVLECKNYQNTTGLSFIKIPLKNYKDFQIEAEITILEGAGALIFGVSDNEYDHYRIELSKTKKKAYFIDNVISLGQLDILNTFNTPQIGNENVIVTIRKVKSTYYLYLNKQFISELNSIDLYGTRIGIGVSVNSSVKVNKIEVCHLEDLKAIEQKRKPNLTASDIILKDTDGNNAIDADELCSLSFKLANSGQTAAKYVNINMSEIGQAKGLRFEKSIQIKTVPAESFIDVTVSISGKEITENGTANLKFSFSESDTYTYKDFSYAIDVKAKEIIVKEEPKALEYRNALIIGNSNYKSSPLDNPINDAKAMAEALRKLNFDVIELIDGDKKAMRDSVREFKSRMKQDRGVGLFYYAGHGVQVKGENYLIPVNHDIQEEYDVQDEALRVSTVLSYMQDAGTRMNIVILDACRDNPFARSMRSGSRGLATIYAEGSGSIIAYATAPGSTASDGTGENGLYTQELLKAINTPGLEIGMVFRHVLAKVQKISKGKQIPWTNSSLIGEFYFKK